ncbi:pyridoxal phosphate-dependent decarboxylase family protein [Pinibacter aurantiacus]|uniref:Aspartate aminotransferase family protein n=1 Tax=Pinibacter aurantiacus TaxID=2851599 RepID=A0A9E2W2P3_9BACT|nr:pyridoxal-dependent decarboxylase [Pinibacter aurantiacus]MBV4356014.1 aspartate aminotransferase family protein [Pinibacter aurantiacus]
MNRNLANDNAQIEQILDAAKRLSISYLQRLDERPVSIDQPSHHLPLLSKEGLGAIQTQQLFEKEFLHNIIASSGPRYYGFVTGGTTPAAIAGDWLTSVFDQNTQNAKGNGDVSAMLEMHTVQLLLQLFGLPDVFMGAFVTGATMSNFSALAVARQWFGKQKGYDVALEGIQPGIKIYTSVPHSSSVKSLAMLGIGSKNIISVPTLEDRECMDVNALKVLIEKTPDEPFILIASGGTVNTVDFDDMQEIAALKKQYNFWWHVDAAFGGFAACSDSRKHLLKGWENADSITVDNHKWMNVPYDSAVVFTRKEHAILQVQTFQNSNAPYLGNALDDFNYLNYVPENSRRFRALPAWFTLMAYGEEGYKNIVETNIEQALIFGELINQSDGYTLAAPVRLNTVCFTVKEEKGRKEKIMAVLAELNKRGKVFMTPTIYKGMSCIRAAFVNWRTTQEDVDIAVVELNKVFDLLNTL